MDQELSGTIAEDAPSRRLERYLDGAVRLRQAATWNIFDTKPNDRLPRRVIPVVDADVIRMFMAPAAETRYVDPFPADDMEPDSDELREWNEPMALVAAATAEFIFLTDSIKVFDHDIRKWREPLRVASPHLLDVEIMLHQIRIKIEEGLQRSIRELEDDAIERVDSVLEKSRRNDDRNLADLVRELPASLRNLYLGPMYEAERWARLRGTEQLLRLDGLDVATPDVLNPRETLVEDWRDQLYRSLVVPPSSTQGHMRPRDREERRARAQERARRDALAVASVTLLNEIGMHRGPRDGWRAVLISGDDHLHRVYARWAARTSGIDLDPAYYVMRRPLQFTPVLNVADMSGDQSAAGIFRNLTEALDLTVDILFEGSKTPPSRYLLEHHWDHHRRERLKTLDRQGIEKHLNKCNEHWLEAINHINARNHPYLTRDYDRLFDKLKQAFDEPDARKELIEQTTKVVSELDAEHFRLVLDETVHELAHFKGSMRMPFLVLADFPDFLDGDGSLARFFFGDSPFPRMTKHELARLRDTAEKVRQSPNPRGTFLTAILTAATGSYGRAARLVVRARHLASDNSQSASSLRAEMDYFLALMLRLGLTLARKEDYDNASDILKRLFRESASDSIRSARAYSEAAALELSWFCMVALGRGADPSAEHRRLLEQGNKYLKSARNLAFRPRAKEATRQERELEQQIVANVIAAQTYRKLVGGDPDIGMVTWAHDQYEELLGPVIRDADYVTELWWLAAKWLIDPTQKHARELQVHCERTLAERKNQEMPAADRNTLERLQAYLRRAPT